MTTITTTNNKQQQQQLASMRTYLCLCNSVPIFILFDFELLCNAVKLRTKTGCVVVVAVIDVTVNVFDVTIISTVVVSVVFREKGLFQCVYVSGMYGSYARVRVHTCTHAALHTHASKRTRGVRCVACGRVHACGWCVCVWRARTVCAACGREFLIH